MENSVKNTAEKFKAWQKRHSEDSGYCYDEIGEFASSLTRGELLEVFEWLAKSFPDYRPEYIGGMSQKIGDEWSNESMTTQPAVGSFIEKARIDMERSIAREIELQEEVQRNAMRDLLEPKEGQVFKGIFNRFKP